MLSHHRARLKPFHQLATLCPFLSSPVQAGGGSAGPQHTFSCQEKVFKSLISSLVTPPFACRLFCGASTFGCSRETFTGCSRLAPQQNTAQRQYCHSHSAVYQGYIAATFTDPEEAYLDLSGSVPRKVLPVAFYAAWLLACILAETIIFHASRESCLPILVSLATRQVSSLAAD